MFPVCALASTFPRVMNVYASINPPTIHSIIPNRNVSGGYSSPLNKIFFIEFKNGKIEVPETSQSRNHQRRRINRLNIEIAKLKLELIRTKVKDSITACCEIFSKNPDFFRENCYFILVYNEDKNSCIIPDSLDNPGFTSLLQSFSQISQTRFHNFGMDVLEKLCVDEVRTFTPKEFEDFIINYS